MMTHQKDKGHTTRRRFLRYMGFSALAVAVGAGSGGYLIFRKNTASEERTGHDKPITVTEGKIGALERIIVEELPKELKPQAFTTTGGRAGWRVRIPGNRPLATPAVSEGLVFVGGGYGSYEFYAFDEKTGKLVWQIHTNDDGPTAAVVFEDKVCFNTESCTLYVCEKRTGRVIWERWLGDPLMNQPAVARVGGAELLFMAHPGEGGHRLAALELRTGDVVWDVPIDSDLISAPVVSGDSVYASAMSGIVYRFRAADGRLLDEQRLNATSAPWIDRGEILVSRRATDQGLPQEGLLAYDVGRAGERELGLKLEAPYLRPEAQGRLAQQFQAHDSSVGFSTAPGSAQLQKASANLGWQARTVIGGWAYQGARPVVADGRLYTVLGETFQSVDRASGELLWAVRFPSGSEEDRAFVAPAVVGGKLYTGSLDGKVLVLQAQDGRVAWGVELKEPVLFQPAVAAGRVFVTTANGTLYSLEAQDPEADGWPMWGGGPGHNGPTK
jgi:Ca-activated chloride channel family protein